VAIGEVKGLPNYFMECLGYCVPDAEFGHDGSRPLTDDLKAGLFFIWDNAGDSGSAANWYEPNGIKRLFSSDQKWTIQDARKLTYEAWRLIHRPVCRSVVR
jgi:hypothetical protein